MQASPKHKPAKPKLIDIKLLIAVLAVAVTVGFWNLLSNDAYSAEKSSPSVVVTLPPQPPSVAADNLPPLPTLVPLVDVTIPQVIPASDAVNLSQPASQAPAAQPQSSTQLKVVGIPTQVIVQKKKPVFGDTVSAASNSTDSSNSSNSSGGSKSKSSSKSSSSTTKSSKK
jgi:hypothetical protein